MFVIPMAGFFKGFSSQYFPRLECDIKMRVALVWPIVLHKKSEISEFGVPPIANAQKGMLMAWAKGAKPLKSK